MRRVSNPANPFSGLRTEWWDVPPEPHQEIYEEAAKSILSENRSPDVGFRYSVNPYRGCFHACSYCYARPTHQYLDFGAGTDFERKIVAKVNAPELLRAALSKRGWKGDCIVFSGVTDCYQPLEATYELTRRCLEVCLEFRNPVGIITKGALIQRDIPLLKELNERASVKVHVSLAFADIEMARRFEPSTPSPAARFRTMRALAEAGIPVGVGIAPVIPGASETEIPQIIEQASANGAKSAFMTLLRLPAEVEPVFLERLKETYPERIQKITSAILEMKEGKLNRSAFGERMKGTGARWEAVEWLFRSACVKHGLSWRSERQDEEENAPKKPRAEQLSLFKA